MENKARFTIKVTDNLNQKQIGEYNTNVLIGAIRNFPGNGVYLLNLYNANDADILDTLVIAQESIKNICYSCGRKKFYKKFLEGMLEDLEKEEKKEDGQTETNRHS